MVEESRLNVKVIPVPVTVQKVMPGAANKELKFHGPLMLANELARTPMVAKVPESPPTVEVFQLTTWVALFALVVSKTALPLKPMLPVIGAACADWRIAAVAAATTANLINLFFISVFVRILFVRQLPDC